MEDPDANLKYCPNGHRSRDAAARFCIVCGAPLNARPAQNTAQQTPLAAEPDKQPPENAPKSNADAAKIPVQTPFQPPPNSNSPPPVVNQPPPSYDPNYFPQPVPNYYPPPYANQYPPYYPNYYAPPNPYPIPQPVQTFQAPQCRTCGGDGRALGEKTLVCPECRWLRPLAPGYAIDAAAFQWSEDGKAMSALRSIGVLNSMAQTISDKVGRPWIESTFNAVRLGERQLPKIYTQAVHAARILGMSNMPDVYISGEMMWDCRTYGSDKNAFVVIGTALATNFHDADLLFLLAREMGHCRAGHALWKTVIKFLIGEQGARKGILAGGILSALSPTNLIEGAIEMPLLGWARQAEITADRAGLLAVGDESVVRRVLLSWSLKSAFLYRQINVEAWLEQQAGGDDQITKLSELTTSATPYVTRRLKLMEEFAKSPELQRWRHVIDQYTGKPKPEPGTPLGKISGGVPAGAPPPVKQAATDIKLKCSNCGTPMRVPLRALEGKKVLNVRCPNAKCTKVMTLKKKVTAPETAKPADAPNIEERSLNYDNE